MIPRPSLSETYIVRGRPILARAGADRLAALASTGAAVVDLSRLPRPAAAAEAFTIYQQHAGRVRVVLPPRAEPRPARRTARAVHLSESLCYAILAGEEAIAA